MAVKDRQAATDNMFEPLKETIELLQSYDHVMSDAVHQQLEVCHKKLYTIETKGS
jgi:dynein heavy chain